MPEEYLIVDEFDNYDDFIISKVFRDRYFSDCRMWWKSIFKALSANTSPPITYYQAWWEPHHSPATDHINFPALYSILPGDKQALAQMERFKTWPWRTSSDDTLFNLFDLTRRDFPIPSWIPSNEQEFWDSYLDPL